VRTAKILLLGKNLHDDRPLEVELDLVLRAEVALGPPEQFQGAVAVKVGLECVHAQQEAVGFERLEPGQTLLQRDQVVGGDVVAVLSVHFLGQAPALRFLAQPQQVLAELDLGREIRGVEGQRPPLLGPAFPEALFLRELAADCVIDLGVGRPVGQGPDSPALFAQRVALQMRQHGTVRAGGRMGGVKIVGPRRAQNAGRRAQDEQHEEKRAAPAKV